MDKQNEKGMVNLLNQEMRELQENKKQMIEKIAKDIDVNCFDCRNCEYREEPHCTDLLSAKNLYNAGYRKIQDNEIVLTKEEYESLKKGVKTVSYQAMIDASDQQHWLNGYKVGYRDGVIAVNVQTKQALEKIKTELIGEEQK